MTLTQEKPLAGSPTVSEHHFRAPDAARLFYRAWLPRASATRAIILFHRGHEHSGRLCELAQSLAGDHTAIFAWDARGHGRSPGERGYAESFPALVRDAHAFALHLEQTHEIPLSRMAIVAHSVGAVIAAAWVHDYAPPIRAMVLATPAFDVKLYVPFARPSLRLFSRFKPKAFIKSYVKSSMLTHDMRQALAYDQDPLISRQIAVNILLGLHDTAKRLLADARAITTPTLVISAGKDWVVKTAPQRTFFQRISSTTKNWLHFDDMSHAVFHETERQRVFAQVRQFIDRAFEQPSASAPAISDPNRLTTPLPLASSKRWSFAIQRTFLSTIGRLSEGIRIGWQTGFDSGQSLDHVYTNRARGFTPLGRLIDRIYLNSIGWRNIRRRKVHLEQLLRHAIDELAPQRVPIHIVDIASGPARYLLDVLKQTTHVAVSATCRDRSEPALETGRNLAVQLNLDNITFASGDSFDRAALSRLTPRPDIAIISGFFELFPDNDKIRATLDGLAAAMSPGSVLLYTNQPWHPQLEMIARVLINRERQPWIMRCRPQAEMDDLVRRAGFEKIHMLIDDDGIFTVSLARRV